MSCNILKHHVFLQALRLIDPLFFPLFFFPVSQQNSLQLSSFPKHTNSLCMLNVYVHCTFLPASSGLHFDSGTAQAGAVHSCEQNHTTSLKALGPWGSNKGMLLP